MANQFFSTQNVISQSVATASSLLVPLTDFATVLPLPAPQAGKVNVPMIVSTPAVQSNPSNFEAAADSTLESVELTPEHLNVTGHVAYSEFQSGADLNWLAQSLMNTFAQATISRATAALTTANFSSTAWTGQPTAFDLAAVGACRTAIKTPRRCLLLGTACFNAIAQYLEPVGNRWTLPGFVAVYEVDSLPSGVLGAVVDPVALVVGIGSVKLPDIKGAPFSEVVPLPGLGVTVQAMYWISQSNRAAYMSIDSYLAVKPAQTSKGALLLSS